MWFAVGDLDASENGGPMTPSALFPRIPGCVQVVRLQSTKLGLRVDAARSGDLVRRPGGAERVKWRSSRHTRAASLFGNTKLVALAGYRALVRAPFCFFRDRCISRPRTDSRFIRFAYQETSSGRHGGPCRTASRNATPPCLPLGCWSPCRQRCAAISASTTPRHSAIRSWSASR